MKKSGNSNVKSIIIILVFVAILLACFYRLTNKEREQQAENPKLTAVQEVLLRNLESNYPPTPKEVVKYYAEITQCFYNEEYTDSELEQLADKADQLYDTDLAEHNNWGEYIISLRKDISEFKEEAITISTYYVSASTDVDRFEDDGFEFARLHCIFTLKQGNYKQDVDIVFLLRKDAEGHWKIYGWDDAKNVNPQ